MTGTNIEWTIIEEFEAAIEEMPGVTINGTQALHVGDVAIDFSFSWPGKEPAEWPLLRREAVENSAIIIEDTIYVSEWQLRLPPIGKEENPAREATADALERQFDRIYDAKVKVRLAADNDVWTPHVNDQDMFSPEAAEVIEDIAQIWERYREMVLEQGEFGRVL